MMARVKANLTAVGRGSLGRGVAVVVAGLLVACVVVGVVASQPTAAAGLCIGWVVAVVAFGGAAADGPGDRPAS